MSDLMRPNTPGLALIEGNERLLRRQGHTAAGDLLFRSLASSQQQGSLRLWRTPINSEGDLKVATEWAKLTKYPAVVIVAHSSDSGVEAAPNRTLTWEDAADRIAPLEPSVILNVSCSGGSMKPTRALFERIPSLDAVMGSPVPMKSTEALLAMLEVVARACGAKVPVEWSSLATTLNLFLTRSIVWTRTREQYVRNTPLEMATEDLAAGVLKALFDYAFDDSLPPRRRTRRRRQLASAGLL